MLRTASIMVATAVAISKSKHGHGDLKFRNSIAESQNDHHQPPLMGHRSNRLSLRALKTNFGSAPTGRM